MLVDIEKLRHSLVVGTTNIPRIVYSDCEIRDKEIKRTAVNSLFAETLFELASRQLYGEVEIVNPSYKPVIDVGLTEEEKEQAEKLVLRLFNIMYCRCLEEYQAIPEQLEVILFNIIYEFISSNSDLIGNNFHS